MFDDEFDDDDLDDAPEFAPKPPVKGSGSKWLVLGSFFELITNIFKAFAQFFDSLTDESLATYRRAQNKDKFVLEASREIEMLINGDYDATTSQARTGFGTGTSESAD